MKINNNDLKTLLEIAGKGVTKTSTMPAFACVDIKVDNDIAVILTGNSHQNIIQVARVEAIKDEKWEALIDYTIFSALVNKFSGDTTQITRKDDKVIIKNSRSKTEMAIQEGELPLAPITDKQEVIELTKEEWLKYMKPLIYAIAIDDTRPILQCVCLNGNNNDTTDVVALDGYRIAKSVLPKKSNINCIIDGTTIKIITDIINKEKEKTIIKIYKTDSKLIFTIGTCSIISGIISGEYIQYQRIIPDTESMDSLEVSRVDLIHTLDRLKISQKNTPMVLLKISDSKIMLSANSEIAKMHEELPINSGIENFEIAFNINYLIDAAKQFDEEKITIYFGGSQNPCIVKNDYMLALLLPVRIGAYNA